MSTTTETQALTTLRLLKPVVGDPVLTTFGFQVVLPDNRIIVERFGFATSADALDAGANAQKHYEALQDMPKRSKKGKP